MGCSNSVFNVQDVPLTGVSGFDTGDKSTGTVTFALSHVDIAHAAASGMAVLPVAEVAEALFSGASKQVAVAYNDPRISQERTVSAQVSFPSLPTACIVDLQESDDDTNYYDVSATHLASVSGGTLTGGFQQVTDSVARFYRLNISSITGGTSATVVTSPSPKGDGFSSYA
jgi:hypothetical protein